MKKIFALFVVSLFIFSCLATEALAKDLKIGYVDTQRVFTEYKKTKEAEGELEKEGKSKTDERNKMVEGIRRLKDEMELLSDKGKDKKQEEIDKKIKELQDFDRGARNELLQEREDIIRAISKDIDKIIAEYGKKQNYDLILNRNKGVLLFERDELDITDDIIKRLNR